MEQEISLAKGTGSWINSIKFISLPVLVITLTTIILPAEAHSPDVVLSGFGTATIDGTLSPGEWDTAGHIDFSPNFVGYSTAATFFAMNDADNMYLALRIETPPLGSQVSPLSFVMEFDNDHDGVREEGDDAFVLNPPGRIYDDFRSFLPPCPPGGCGPSDTSFERTNDGIGRVSNAGFFFNLRDVKTPG